MSSEHGARILLSAKTLVAEAIMDGFKHHPDDDRSAISFALTALMSSLCILGRMSAPDGDEEAAKEVLEFLRERLAIMWPRMKEVVEAEINSLGGQA